MPFTSGGEPSAGWVIQLDAPSFYILLGVLALFVAMYLALRANTRSRKALEGFREAIFVDAAFLLFSVALVVVLAWQDPRGNRVAWSIAETILGGLWLTFSIPVVTVGFSVHSKTRGEVAWMIPSILFAAGLFVLIYFYTYTTS